MSLSGWQAVQDEVLRRIHARDWPPGSAIPNEADLAREFGVARATVNRALQALAEAGLLDRKRKAGTRVALHPVRKATLSIPILRHEIEARGLAYGYRLLTRTHATAPVAVQAALGLTRPLLHLTSLHLAADRPYAYEDRWINTDAVPDILTVDLAVLNANQWLVAHAPFTRGDFVLAAVNAGPEAGPLGIAAGAALMVLERTTWDGAVPITWVRLAFAPGHRMQMVL